MCACTEPVRIGIGAVCVEYGRPKWTITMLNHTHKQINKDKYMQKNVLFLIFGTLCSYDRYEEAFLPEGKKRPQSVSYTHLTLPTIYSV